MKIVYGRILEQDDARRKLDAGQDDVHRGAAPDRYVSQL